VTVNLRFKKFLWIEDVIQLVEECASCDLYSILKRPDEKYVTEKAYDNPMFVEDVVREIAKRLKMDRNITWFTVESENFESIHNHSAYAYVERGNGGY
jgi:GTP cyclohydrolase I